jgi:hypothetical protein
MITTPAPNRITPSPSTSVRQEGARQLLAAALVLLGNALLSLVGRYERFSADLLGHDERRKDLQAMAHSGIHLASGKIRSVNRRL